MYIEVFIASSRLQAADNSRVDSIYYLYYIVYSVYSTCFIYYAYSIYYMNIFGLRNQRNASYGSIASVPQAMWTSSIGVLLLCTYSWFTTMQCIVLVKGLHSQQNACYWNLTCRTHLRILCYRIEIFQWKILLRKQAWDISVIAVA